MSTRSATPIAIALAACLAACGTASLGAASPSATAAVTTPAATAATTAPAEPVRKGDAELLVGTWIAPDGFMYGMDGRHLLDGVGRTPVICAIRNQCPWSACPARSSCLRYMTSNCRILLRSCRYVSTEKTSLRFAP